MKLLLFVSLLLLTQERFLAPRCLFQVNTTFTDSLRNLLLNNSQNDDYRLQLALLYKNLAQSSRNFLQLTPLEASLLQTIAQSNTKAAFEAQCIRYLTHGEEYQIQLPPLPQEVLNGYWQMYINFKNGEKTSETDLNIYPNPASANLTIYYSDNKTAPIILEWYSVEGKLHYIQTFSQSGVYQTDISLWPNGVYYCRIISDIKQLGVRKIIIAH